MARVFEVGFTCVLIIIVGIGLYLSRGWNSTTALFPRLIGIPMLGLLAVILVTDVVSGRRRREPGEGRSEEGVVSYGSTRRTAIYFGWLVGFGGLIWLIGMVYAIPIYVCAYLKTVGKYSWLRSAIYAAAAAGVIILLFEYAFRVAWPEGALVGGLSWLR